jgi:putative endonuclease
MFTVYVLYSPSHNKIYIGYTLKYRPWEIIHTEFFETKLAAMKREIELKSANGRQFIWNLIKNKAN